MYRSPHCSSQAGFTLLEIMVSLGLLVMTLVLAIPMIVSQRRTLAQLNTGATCSMSLNNIVNSINTQGGLSGAVEQLELRREGLVLDLNQLTDPRYAQLRDYLSTLPAAQGNQFHLMMPNQDMFGGVTAFNKYLTSGSVGLLALTYNSYPEICSNSEIPAFVLYGLGQSRDTPLLDTQQMQPLLPKGARDVSIRAAIVPYDINTQRELGCQSPEARTPLWPRPRNAHSMEEIFFPNFADQDNGQPDPRRKRMVSYPEGSTSQVGLVLKLYLEYEGQDGVPQSCINSQKFEYPVDARVIFQPRQVPGGPLLTAREELEADFKANFKPKGIRQTFVWNDSTGNHTGEFAWEKSLKREKCSQRQITAARFDLDIKVPEHVEPGTIMLCRDLSLMRAQADNRNKDDVTWCNGRDNAKVPLWNEGTKEPGNHPYVPGFDSNWVPCQELKVCGVEPGRMWTREEFRKDHPNVDLQSPDLQGFVLRYQTDRDNRDLWGCDVYVDVALVDMAGNTLSLATMFRESPTEPEELVQERWLKEAAAEIYFKTTDCYLCKKKKRGLGGLGALFKLVIFIALVVFTGGAYAAAMMATSGLMGALSIGCLVSLCHSDDRSFSYADWPNLKRECQKIRKHKCKPVKAPNPAWKVMLEEGDECKGTYIFPQPLQAEKEDYELSHGDELFEQRYKFEVSHEGRTGWICTVDKLCNNGQLVDAETDPEDPGDYTLNGCSPIYVQREILNAPPDLGNKLTGNNPCSAGAYPEGAIKELKRNFTNHLAPNGGCLMGAEFSNHSLDPQPITQPFPSDDPPATANKDFLGIEYEYSKKNVEAHISYSPEGKLCWYKKRQDFSYYDDSGSYSCAPYWVPTTVDGKPCLGSGEIGHFEYFNPNQHKDLPWCEGSYDETLQDEDPDTYPPGEIFKDPDYQQIK